MHRIIFLSVCIYFGTFAAAQPTTEANQCTHLVANDGSTYDLTVLMEKGEHTIQGVHPDFGKMPLNKGCGGDAVCKQDGTAGTCLCFLPCSALNQFCYGLSVDQEVIPLDDGKGVLIHYKKAYNLGTRLHLLCDYNYVGMDQYNITKDRTGPIFDVMILTDAACPIIGGGLSGGTIFLICVLGVCIMYLVAGILINKFSRLKNGREVVPNVDFWTSLPGLVVVGAKFSFHKITCGTPRNGYSTVE